MTQPDLLAMARSALAASSRSEDLQIATFYCASARLAVEQLREELGRTENAVLAREKELVARTQPRAQLAMEGT